MSEEATKFRAERYKLELDKSMNFLALAKSLDFPYTYSDVNSMLYTEFSYLRDKMSELYKQRQSEQKELENRISSMGR